MPKVKLLWHGGGRIPSPLEKNEYEYEKVYEKKRMT
jgi:DNA-binding protein H-NS